MVDHLFLETGARAVYGKDILSLLDKCLVTGTDILTHLDIIQTTKSGLAA